MKAAPKRIDIAGLPVLISTANAAVLRSESAEPRASISVARGLAGIDVAPPDAEQTSSWNMVLPAGAVLELRDGRTFTNSNPQALVDAFNADPMFIMVDVNHLSVEAELDPPSSGWITKMDLRDGAVWGHIEWTDLGLDALARRHYRYLSPAFYHTEDGEILGFASVGLVNQPAMTMPALARRSELGAVASQAGTPAPADTPLPTKKESVMDEEQLAALRAKLGLADDADVSAIMAAIPAAEQPASGHKDQPGDNGADADPAQRAEPAPTVNVDLDNYVPRADYDALSEHASKLEAEAGAAPDQAEVSELLDGAVAAARIAPASRAHYVSLCSTRVGFDKVKSLLKVAPKVVSTEPNKDLRTPVSSASRLSADEVAICKALGIPQKDFIARRAEKELSDA